MLPGFLILLVCQLAGELLVRAMGLLVPGPVVGMALLLLLLVSVGRVPATLRQCAEGLLRHLALLYVPAGVGLMNHLGLLADAWAALLLALFVSTLVTLVVTAWVLRRLSRRSPLDVRD